MSFITFVFPLGLVITLILLIFCSYYRTRDEKKHKSLLAWGMSTFITTMIITTMLLIINGTTRYSKSPYHRTENTAVVDTTSVKYHVMRNCDEQIARQLKYEKSYNEQRPQSCYADAIDYTDLYAIKEMIEHTDNCDSLLQLNNELYNIVCRLDNYTHELFKREGIHE